MSGVTLWAAARSVRRAFGLPRPSPAASAHALFGRPVVDASWHPMGTLYDLVVLPEAGRVVGAVVAHTDPFGDDLLSVVPWSALRLGTTCDRIVLLPHVTTASQPAASLRDPDGDRYRCFVAIAGAELGRGDRRPLVPAAIGMGVAAVALLALAPVALAAGLLAAGALLVGTPVGRQTTVGLLRPEAAVPHAAPPPSLSSAVGVRVVDVEFEVVDGDAEAVAAPWAAPPNQEPGPARITEERRVRLLRVMDGGPAHGCTIGSLDLAPIGGRVLGRWRGDCYVPEPASPDRLAGGDLVAVVLWLDAAGDALAHLHRIGLQAA